jgi:hypothetical protein
LAARLVLTRGLTESFKTEKGQRVGCESGDRSLVVVTESAEDGQIGESCFVHEKEQSCSGES